MFAHRPFLPRLILVVILLFCARAGFSSTQEGGLDLTTIPDVPDANLLEIDEQVRAVLDEKIAIVRDMRARAFALHTLLFGKEALGIVYDDSITHTAQQTFITRRGNCLSHASLYLAAARYVGLDARFQLVSIPREWVPNEKFNIVPGHINVAVVIPGHKVTVEFSNIVSADESQHMRSRTVDDSRALAEYYNNLGTEAAQNGNPSTAIAYLRKAITTDERVAYAWSNLGVVYKMNGYNDLAQHAYEKGLKIDKDNLSILNNIYILYRETGQHERAEKIAARVERYSRRNPYYLAKLAKSDLAEQQISEAIQKLKRAIALKPEEADFYLALARAYFANGDTRMGKRQLQIGMQRMQTQEERQKFKYKLSQLKQSEAGA
ncbi:tetratricopeptide repeat protein [Teredinibacter turnerae]|uniref:tetratricopeptide repeat protein n=1 Tax=Teredinibacter turnerae TaxID=2426 RepID=UPI0003F86C74|nr:tetratricopeptide repeat protein [Teredinibacter turnerae]